MQSPVGYNEQIDSDSIGEGSNSLDDIVREQTTVTPIGKTKTFAGLEREEWIFLSISVTNILIAVAFTIVKMVDVGVATPDFTFAIIVVINAVFCIFYAIHGVLREREFEIYGYIAAITVVFLYIVINLAVKTNHIDAIKWARFAMILILAPFNIYYGVKVAKEFGFLEFKTVGAAVTLQKMYRKAGVFSCLLKFDFQLALSLAVLVINNPKQLDLSDKIIVGVGVPFQFLWSVLGWLLMRKEQKNAIAVFAPAALVEPAYIIYQLYTEINQWPPSADSKFLSYSFIAVAVIAILVRVLVLIALKFVVDNFGKGLRESVYNLPMPGNQPPLLPRKRDIAKCCGVVCCGPIG